MYGNAAGNWFLSVVIAQMLFFIVTIILIIWLVKDKRSDKNPEQVLRMRLASGDITRKEYSETLNLIRKPEAKKR